MRERKWGKGGERGLKHQSQRNDPNEVYANISALDWYHDRFGHIYEPPLGVQITNNISSL